MLLLAACTQALPAVTGSSTQDEPAELLQLRQKYGLDMGQLKPDDPRIPGWTRLGMDFNPVPNVSYPKMFSKPGEFMLLDAELAKYPSDFFRKVPLNGIYWSTQLENGPPFFRKTNNGVGLNFFNQRIAIINVGTYPSWSQRMVRTLHHEIFHTIDDRILSGYPEWDRCNPPGTSYQFFATQPNSERARRHPDPGFVTAYSRTGAHEDRAELFSMMMAGPTEAQLLQGWIDRGDKILACKAEVMRTYLGTHFPGFDFRRLHYVQLGLKGEQLAQALSDPARVSALDLSILTPSEVAPQPSASPQSYSDPYAPAGYGPGYGSGPYGSGPAYGSIYGTGYGTGYISPAPYYGSGPSYAYGYDPTNWDRDESYPGGSPPGDSQLVYGLQNPGSADASSINYDYDGGSDPTLGEALVMPATIAEFTGLESLKVNRVPYSDLPPELARLKGLKRLELDGTRFTRLPEAIYALAGLQTLSIGGNDLRSVPDRLERLPELASLSLYLDTATPGPFLAGLPRLTKLSLALRGNETLGRSLDGLSKLEDLSLDTPALVRLPADFGMLASLKRFRLYAPRLQALPESFAELKALEELELSRIGLKSVPAALLGLGSLKRLNLSWNRLRTVPEELFELPGLKALDLSANQIPLKDLPALRDRAKARGIEITLNYQQSSTTIFPESDSASSD